MAIALVVGSVGLYLTRATNPAPTPHLAVTLSQLPTESRTAADHTIDLSIATPGHVEVVAAMALPHDLAVTTTQIPANAIITGSTPGHVNFHVTWVGRDKVMGFSIVRLGVHVPALTFAPLPSSKWVVAVSPILKSSTDAPQYAWANTILGDPEIDATGVQVKDLDIGLLDFPFQLDGEIVLLCWKMGETEIRHWHTMDGGFAGRQTVDERFRRPQKQKPN